jgi:hypothetical protein
VRLVNLGETGGATRRAARRSEFDPARRKLAEKLTTDQYGRLLRAGGDTFEICHEQLITQWPWWQNGLNAAATDVRALGQLIQKAVNWSSGGKARHYLATGAELTLFKELANRRTPWLSGAEVAFVGAARRWSNIGRAFAWAAFVVVVVALCLAEVGLYLAARAAAEATANESRALAALSDAADRASNPHAAFKLALAAWPRSASDSFRPHLLRTAQALSRATAGPLALVPDMKHDGTVRGVMFDMSEARILSWSDDGTVRLWDAATGPKHGRYDSLECVSVRPAHLPNIKWLRLRRHCDVRRRSSPAPGWPGSLGRVPYTYPGSTRTRCRTCAWP